MERFNHGERALYAIDSALADYAPVTTLEAQQDNVIHLMREAVEHGWHTADEADAIILDFFSKQKIQPPTNAA